MAKPIKLFWWKPVPNFGDHLNPHVVAHLSGCEVQHAWMSSAELMAIGSVIASVANSNPEKTIYVWGAGAMNPDKVVKSPNAVFCAVRGALTAKALGLSENTPLGDPGLFVSDFVPKSEPSGKIGIILHHTKIASDELMNFVSERPDQFSLISPLREDPLEVVREISACSFVVSNSLHGLVVADAYGIPNRWIEPNGIHMRPMFKFKDYASAIGRSLGDPISYNGVVDFLSLGKFESDVSYMRNIDAVKVGLRSAFPHGVLS